MADVHGSTAGHAAEAGTTPAPPGGTATLAGRQVARIGFGAMQLPGPGVWGPPRDRDREHGVAWVPFFPLGSAFPGMPKVAEHPDVVAAAAELGATPAQVGLAWLLAHDPRVLLIPGTSNLAHLADNMATADVRLDPRTIKVLDGLAGSAA